MSEKKGFRIIYAKSGGSPINIFFEKKMKLLGFIINNLDYIDYLSINDVLIDKNKFVDENKTKINRFLKINRLYDI